MAQHDVRVVAALACRQIFPDGAEVERQLHPGNHAETYVVRTPDGVTRSYPFGPFDLACCVSPREIFETFAAKFLPPRIDDVLGRDWLPYSGD